MPSLRGSLSDRGNLLETVTSQLARACSLNAIAFQSWSEDHFLHLAQHYCRSGLLTAIMHRVIEKSLKMLSID